MTVLRMGGGHCASPSPASVLQCESAGLGWPPNVRTPCAGLPRRLLRGAGAGARDDRGWNACNIVLCRRAQAGSVRPSNHGTALPHCHTFAARPCSCCGDSRFGFSCRGRAIPRCERGPRPRAKHLDRLCAGRITSRANSRRTSCTGDAGHDWRVGQQSSQAGVRRSSHPKRGDDLPHTPFGLSAYVSADPCRDVERPDIPVHRGFQSRDGHCAGSYSPAGERGPCSVPKVASTDFGQFAKEDRNAQGRQGQRRLVPEYPVEDCQPTNLSRRRRDRPVWKKLPPESTISSIDRIAAHRPGFFYRRKHAEIVETFLQTTRFAVPRSSMPPGETE